MFTDALGHPLSEARLRWAFWGLLRDAGLPRIRLHDLDLRHTMATLMLAAGEHPKVVSERLGSLDTQHHARYLVRVTSCQGSRRQRLSVSQRRLARFQARRPNCPLEGHFSHVGRQFVGNLLARSSLASIQGGRTLSEPQILYLSMTSTPERAGFEPAVAHHHTAFPVRRRPSFRVTAGAT